MKYLMKCGHTANATSADGKPICAICLGVKPGADEIAKEADLTGRKARCSYYGSKCHSIADSNFSLPFFEHRPDREYDSFYCGCWGWD